MSVPHVPLIPLDLMSAQQSLQFILKAQLAMVLLLPGDVLFNLLQVGLANREIRIPPLPLEISSPVLAPGARDWTPALIPSPTRLARWCARSGRACEHDLLHLPPGAAGSPDSLRCFPSRRATPRAELRRAIVAAGVWSRIPDECKPPIVTEAYLGRMAAAGLGLQHLLTRLCPHHRARPRPRRRNLAIGAHPQQPRQPGLRSNPQLR